MEPSYSRSWSLRCVLEGPLAPYVSSFTKSLDDQGFAPESSRGQTRLAADFSRWLKQTHAVLPAITDVHIASYLPGVTSRRLYAGRHQASNQAPAWFVPRSGEDLGFDDRWKKLSTPHQRFACARLVIPYLTHSMRLFFNAHHHVS